MGDMRRIAILLAMLAACEEPAEECENASGESSSGAVESSGEDSSSESTGEPAPTCMDIFECYSASCREIALTLYGCTLPNGPTCSYQDARDFGSPECADAVPADADAPSGYAACVSLELAECLGACGPMDFHAYEMFHVGTGISGFGNSYSGALALHCPD